MEKQSPFISVIIPAYNHEMFVADAINSVLFQTFADFEVIVIDDGSTDNTFTVIKNISDSRLRLYRHDNIGAAATINRGIDLSRGQYVTILNSDDLFHLDRLSVFKAYMDDHPEMMVLSSLVLPVDAFGAPLKPGTGNDFHDYWLKWYDSAIRNLQQDDHHFFSLLQSNFVVSTSNIFVNSRIFQEGYRFDPFLSYCHDYAFLLKVTQKHRFGFIHRELLKYRLHTTNTIRHDHFLKRLEVQYAVFHSLNLDDILSDVSNPQIKMSSIVYRGLEKNPDINIGIRLEEKERMLEKSHVWMKEIQTLRAADQERLKYLHSLVAEKDTHIQERDNQLQLLADEIRQKDKNLQQLADEMHLKDNNLQLLVDEIRQKDDMLQLQSDEYAKYQEMKENHEVFLKTQIHQQEMQIQEYEQKIIELKQILSEKERFLQEIFNSKGWRWLTRFRSIKQNLSSKTKSSLILKPAIDEKTYHAKILYEPNENRPKVVHALANFLTGGSSRLVVDLVEHLGHKYDQEVISFFIPTPLAYSGITLHDFSGSITERQIEKFLNDKKTKILHVHYWGEGDAPWYRKVFAAAENWQGILIENVNTPVVPFVSGRIDRYVYVSEYAKNFATCDETKSSVIYPGSNLTMFDRKELPISDDVIGMVYRLDSDKLKEDAIRVFIQVVKKRPRTQVLIVGGGEFFHSYQRQVAEEGASANFQFTGYVPYDKLPEYYGKMSIFVAPVWKESFGQVSPFAMSMKLPVAGYRVGALPEILGSEELLADKPEELAAVIVRLLDDRKRRIEIGETNFLRVHERFSVDAMVESYDKLYENLLSERTA